MTSQEKAAAMKLDSPQMAAAPTEIRNNALLEIKAALLANRKAIFDANAQDLEQAQQNNIPEAVVKSDCTCRSGASGSIYKGT